MSEHRRLTEQEREGLHALLDVLDDVRSAVIKLRDLGWQPSTDIDRFDDGREIIRALATDTRSLVRGSVAPPFSSVARVPSTAGIAPGRYPSQRSNDAPSTGANPALIRTQHTTDGEEERDA